MPRGSSRPEPAAAWPAHISASPPHAPLGATAPLHTPAQPADSALPRPVRPQVEARLRQLEGKQLAGESSKPRGNGTAEKYDGARQGGAAALLAAPKAYNADADAVVAKKDKKPKKAKAEAAAEEAPAANGADEKKKKRKVRGAAAAAVPCLLLAVPSALPREAAPDRIRSPHLTHHASPAPNCRRRRPLRMGRRQRRSRPRRRRKRRTHE